MMLRPAYPISTARLTLRPYTADDLDDLYDIQSRPEVTRYLLFGTRDRDEVRASLEEKIKASVLEDEGGNLTLAVVLPGSGTVIGDVTLFWTSRRHRQGEIGYAFHPDHDGRNTASARVLERLGMRREAHFVQNEFIKGEWTDEIVYATLRGEWRERCPGEQGRPTELPADQQRHRA